MHFNQVYFFKIQPKEDVCVNCACALVIYDFLQVFKHDCGSKLSFELGIITVQFLFLFLEYCTRM